MSGPLVTIIIPSYNYGKFLQWAVESVLDQSYAFWECLIIDDGSVDDTSHIAGRLTAKDQRIKYYYKENGGLSSARNYGLSLSKGDFICFLDADDRLDNNKLADQLRCFEENPDADIVYGRAMFFENDDRSALFYNKAKTDRQIFSRLSGSGKKLLHDLVVNNITVVSAPLVRSSVFKKVGGFDESYRSYEDWHFWARCAFADMRFVYCESPAVCTYIRFGHESMMSDKRKLVLAGIQLRRFFSSRLSGLSGIYNFYRLLKLYLKLRLL